MQPVRLKRKGIRTTQKNSQKDTFFSLQRSEKQEVVENFDRLKTIQLSTVEPHAFTERGLYMLA